MLRIIHNLGGCGGTLLSRCLGVLPEVALLSEINPASVKLFPHFDPIHQDRTWLHLLTKGDAERFSQMDLGEVENFRDLVQVFYDRASAGNRKLILRDYNYVDFVGVPFEADPPRRLTLYSALPPGISTVSLAFIRHPVDQWLSLRKHSVLGPEMTPRLFCDAYDAFLRELRSMTVFKYEEFAERPEQQLQAMCKKLDLPFVPSFLDKFHQFDGVTGDFARLRDSSISLPSRKPMSREIVEEFHSSDSFRSVLAKTGYPEI